MRTSSLLAALAIASGSGCAGSGLDAGEPFSESDIAPFELRADPFLEDEVSEPEGVSGDPAAASDGADDCSEPATDKDILSAIEAARASAAEDFEADFWIHFVGGCLPASAPESDDSVPSLR